MKYGFAFTLLAALLAIYAARQGDWFWLLLWPSFSFALVGAAYLGFGTTIFGKQPTGLLSPTRTLMLAPFHVYVILVWHAVRHLSREPAWNRLTESLYIGRRLLSNERAEEFDHIVDLTCEFNEPAAMRESGYISFPTLDGHTPSREELLRRVSLVADLEGTVYIHCAQGHGRTATLAVAYLLHEKNASSVDDAVDFLLQRRPAAHLNRAQRKLLDDVYGAIEDSDV